MFISDLKTCFKDILETLQSEDPVFLSRIGGSDTDAVIDYCRVKDAGVDALSAHVAKHAPRVAKYNGFYDRASLPETYLSYCKELIKVYENSEALFFCNYQLLSLYFKDVLNPAFYRDSFENREHYSNFVEALLARNPDRKCYPYQFVEKLVFDDFTLFRAFSIALAGKMVLVVSPFSESIAANYHRRHKFFKKQYVYPEFGLRTLDCPITYSGLPAHLYPHDRWASTVEYLKCEIARVDFDVALLSCGSYAMPLGVYIERSLQRKAVYVGGVLQLFFGIMGRRYQNPFFVDQINSDEFILPLERERYLKFTTITTETAAEAFGAYF